VSLLPRSKTLDWSLCILVCDALAAVDALIYIEYLSSARSPMKIRGPVLSRVEYRSPLRSPVKIRGSELGVFLLH